MSIDIKLTKNRRIMLKVLLTLKVYQLQSILIEIIKRLYRRKSLR